MSTLKWDFKQMVKIINYEELTILILMNFRIKRDKIVIFFLKKNQG